MRWLSDFFLFESNTLLCTIWKVNTELNQKFWWDILWRFNVKKKNCEDENIAFLIKIIWTTYHEKKEFNELLVSPYFIVIWNNLHQYLLMFSFFVNLITQNISGHSCLRTLTKSHIMKAYKWIVCKELPHSKSVDLNKSQAANEIGKC